MLGGCQFALQKSHSSRPSARQLTQKRGKTAFLIVLRIFSALFMLQLNL